MSTYRYKNNLRSILPYCKCYYLYILVYAHMIVWKFKLLWTVYICKCACCDYKQVSFLYMNICLHSKHSRVCCRLTTCDKANLSTQICCFLTIDWLGSLYRNFGKENIPSSNINHWKFYLKNYHFRYVPQIGKFQNLLYVWCTALKKRY